MKAEAAAGARQSRLLEGGEDRSGRAALPVARGAQQCAEPLEVAVGNGCIARRNENHSDKLQCDVQKLLKANSHTWLWTPPYCPWLQPIETFWAHGKNHAASKNRNGEHSPLSPPAMLSRCVAQAAR